MDNKLKEVLRQAVLVVEYREGDIDTEDGCMAVTDIDSMIRLQAALCDALGAESDDVTMLDLGAKINALRIDTRSCCEIMWAEMSPDIYDGPNCDQVRPRWNGYASGDMQDDYRSEPIVVRAEDCHPGTKVIVLEPQCTKCGEIASMCRDNESCDFDWDEWIEDVYQ